MASGFPELSTNFQCSLSNVTYFTAKSPRKCQILQVQTDPVCNVAIGEDKTMVKTDAGASASIIFE